MRLGRLGLIVVLLRAGTILACTAPAAGTPPPAPQQTAALAREATPAAAAAPAAVTPAPTAPPRVRVAMAYSVLSGDPLPMLIAQDQGFFERYGLEADLTYIGGSTRITEAIIAGEIKLAQIGGAAAVSAGLSGADVIMIGTVVPVFVTTLFSRPEITSVADLRGKSIAVTAIGTTTDFAGRVALRRAGLEPLRDVAIIQAGGAPEVLAAIQAGNVAGGVLTPPNTLRAREAGLRELVDLTALRIPYEQAPLGTTRRFIEEQPATVRAFLRAITEGIAVAKQDRALAKRVLARYTRVEDDALLEETYRLYVEDALPRAPYVTREGVQTILDLLDHPRAPEATPEQFFDNRFVQELDRSGFIDSLYPTPQR
jgi:NitT/TauT family transport system substrate-binding protein